MSLTNFPVELVLLGMIAAFLILRLRSVLGKRTGFEREGVPSPRPGRVSAIGKVIDVLPDAAPGRAMPRSLPERDSPVGHVFGLIQAIDGQFSPGRFLDGAEGAFRLIVIAFATGDRGALRPLLTSPMMEIFDEAIALREALKQTQHTTLHSIRSVTIEDASLERSCAKISVQFVSDQVSHTDDFNSHIVVGTDAVTEITDLWIFERDLASRDPAWRLTAARTA